MINRRSFFGALAVAPIATVAAAKSDRIRVSCIEGDPGERLYGQLCLEGKTVKVFLNGIEMIDCVTADEAAGEVTCVCGFNRTTGKILYETLLGDVRVEII